MFRLISSSSSSMRRHASTLLLKRQRASSSTKQGSFVDASNVRSYSSAFTLQDDNDNNSSSKSSSSSSILPSRITVGEDVPRMPHTYALPLVSRPLFPGLISSVTLTDLKTIEALETLVEQQPSGHAFVSTFLRRNLATGVTEGGVHLPAPELIQSESDIYHVGTFAQIQRLQRSSPSSDDDEDDNDNEPRPHNNHQDHNTATLILLAHRRVDLVAIDDLGPPIDCQVKHWPRLEYASSGGGDKEQTIRALSNEIISTIREIAQVNALFRESLQFFPMRVQGDNPFKLADFAASISASGLPQDLQAVLQEKDPEQRLHLALQLLNKERQVSQLQKEISEKVDEKMSQAQRKYFLTEQLKSIKKELGMERDDKEALIEKYRQTLANYPAVPDEVMTVIEEELEKFGTLEKNSPEYNVTRSYLDWLTSIPWGVLKEEVFDLKAARKTLDKHHYGLDEVKETILQFLAIGKLMGGTVQGKILCLAGPPGTGKTSIAQAIADSLGRDFYRFSVGGLSDVSEIKGHRRTYIGAMPGKLMQCLKQTGSTNPVVLIDEIDKLGMGGMRGDPSSALLEVLDPNQNSTFRDYFLDVPVDLSKVLFVCTANELERIPSPLLDRMEIIRMSGYDVPEKMAIAEQYLVPKSLKESGLMVEKKKKKKEEVEPKAEGEGEQVRERDEHEAVQQASSESEDATADAVAGAAESDESKEREEEEVEDDDDEDEGTTPLENYTHSKGVPESLQIGTGALNSLVRWYAREAGVRNLAKYIDKITRKLALQVVAESEGAELTSKSQRKHDTWVVDEDNLSDYVGKPVFTSDRLYQDDPLPNGIVMGLAYTSMGGSALYVETQGIKRGLDKDGKPRGGGTLKATGQLGDVMEESSQIAYTVARAEASAREPSNDYFDNNDIHMHVPEGATPKDGPSAGVTMVTSMLSLALGRPVRSDVAMTGEVSLTGKVLAVGGIKEKIMAARRAGISNVVMPTQCQREYDEIPDYLKEGLDVHFADEYEQVFQVAFGETPPKAAEAEL